MSGISKEQPNIVIVYCDDLGYGDIGCYGSEDIKTPHIDHLADKGVRFTDWYSNSPVCSPSRASLLTGCYPAKTGVTGILGARRGTKGLHEERKTLAEKFHNLGYRTGIFGKWHLGSKDSDKPSRRGFDEQYGFYAGCVDYYSHITYWGMKGGLNPHHDLWHNDEKIWDNGKYLTEAITERAIQFIRKSTDGNKPFFTYVPYNAPHYPMHAPKKYMDRFSHLPWERQVMAAMISAVDDGVGDLAAVLEELNLTDNTVIFFSSDNGPSREVRNWLDGTEGSYHGGTAGQFKGHKHSLFEGGIRVPAVLSYPKLVSPGQICKDPGMMMDIYPTLVDWAGGSTADDNIDGTHLLPLVQGELPETGTHPSFYWKHMEQTAIRKGRWKLVLNGKLDKTETVDPVFLSDLENDPGELSNLAAENTELVKELTSELELWAKEMDDHIKRSDS